MSSPSCPKGREEWSSMANDSCRTNTKKKLHTQEGTLSLLGFWVLFTFRETSFIMSYRNDPWKHSLKFLFSVQTFPDLQRFGNFSFFFLVRRLFNFTWGKSSIHPMETILQILNPDIFLGQVICPTSSLVMTDSCSATASSRPHSHRGKQLIHLPPFCPHTSILFFSFPSFWDKIYLSQ